MKTILLSAVLLWPAAVGAASMESVGANADQAFNAAALQGARLARTARESQSLLQTPSVRVLGRKERLGAELGRVKLASQLDRNLFLLKETLGTRALDMGLAADAGAKKRFLSFTDGAGTTLGAIGNLSDLRGKGVDVRVDANTVYNFRVQVGDIFDDPVHKSILHITPTAGTQGPSTDMTTGDLLNAMRAKSAIVTIDGDEYWFFYGRDALSDGSGFAKTRTLLITHEAGMSTKAWPLDEASLPLDTPTAVSLGDEQVQMTRTSSGDLIVSSSAQ